jgi:hypothetical protein
MAAGLAGATPACNIAGVMGQMIAANPPLGLVCAGFAATFACRADRSNPSRKRSVIETSDSKRSFSDEEPGNTGLGWQNRRSAPYKYNSTY